LKTIILFFKLCISKKTGEMVKHTPLAPPEEPASNESSPFGQAGLYGYYVFV